MFECIDSLSIYLGEQSIGRLALTPQRLCAFEYDPQFLAEGFSISPFYLPLRSGLFTAHREPFDGLFGVFNDSLPDGWGHLLIDRYLASQGIPAGILSILDRLSIVGSAGMGALQYKPDKHIKADRIQNDLNILAAEVQKLLSESNYTQALDILAEKGGSTGGARPKVLIDIKDDPWIVKFPASHDPSEIGHIEFETSLIAKQCGIEMPETALLEEQYFAVRRFDRAAGQRIHMQTASGLLYASHRYPSLDYSELIKASLALTKNSEEAHKLFRLMVFNVLTGNKDDHAKNFSFLYVGKHWRLSPAYDLVPSNGFNGKHATTIAGKGQPEREDLFEVAKICGLNLRKVRAIFDEVYSNCASIRLKSW